MITDKTDFGIDESGYVMSNLIATINSSKDLTQHTLGHNPNLVVIFWGQYENTTRSSTP